MYIKTIAISAMTLFMAAVSAICGQEYGELDDLEICLLSHTCPGGPSIEERLESYAKKCGLSKEDLAKKLSKIVKHGLWPNSDDFQSGLAKNALWGLAKFGGTNEYALVHGIMQQQGDKFFYAALHALFRMVPEKWEDLVREIAADEKYSDYDRFLAYEETFRVGMGGDLNTRNRVIEVLEEMRAIDTSKSNRNSLGLWLTELKGEDWEEWLRKVTTEDGFTSADRNRAYDLAFRIGRDGDEKTRQHVLAVLKEMWDKEDVRGVKNILGHLIKELENR